MTEVLHDGSQGFSTRVSTRVPSRWFSRVLHEGSTGVLRGFFMGSSRVLHGFFTGSSRVLHGFFTGSSGSTGSTGSTGYTMGFVNRRPGGNGG
jgi:hypothetical protein